MSSVDKLKVIRTVLKNNNYFNDSKLIQFKESSKELRSLSLDQQDVNTIRWLLSWSSENTSSFVTNHPLEKSLDYFLLLMIYVKQNDNKESIEHKKAEVIIESMYDAILSWMDKIELLNRDVKLSDIQTSEMNYVLENLSNKKTLDPEDNETVYKLIMYLIYKVDKLEEKLDRLTALKL